MAAFRGIPDSGEHVSELFQTERPLSSKAATRGNHYRQAANGQKQPVAPKMSPYLFSEFNFLHCKFDYLSGSLGSGSIVGNSAKSPPIPDS